MKSILLISPYWKEDHRWMVSSVKLADLWQQIGYRVVVVCMGNQPSTINHQPSTKNSRLHIEQVSDTLEIHRMKDIFIPDPWNYGIAFGFTGYVRKLIKKEKPDIIIANKLLFWTTLSVISLRLTGHKVLVLTDALVGITWWPRNLVPKICAAIYAWTFGWLILLCAKRVGTFHPQNPSILKKLGIAKKVEVIPTGIDSSKFQVPSSKFQNEDITVTYVGRLESVKGVDDFVAAAASVKKDFPSLNVQVVGWYKEGHPIVEKYQQVVSFTGLRDDVANILSKTDIFVLPSYSEGLSNALMEAMASGCACIATEVGGNRFLIQNGVSGFLFTPGDRDALKAHLRRLIEDEGKRKALGEAARKRIEEEFDWKVVGEKYKKLFNNFLAL
ncbi:glycosyltransferase [Patescibacteria group bacterium]|nr:glycosyltransferase [Patescibacteria group bacterium]